MSTRSCSRYFLIIRYGGQANAVTAVRNSARLAAWAFHLSPPLDDVLHWQALVPTTGRAAWTLIIWTLPLVAVYCGLGVLRTQRDSERWKDSDSGTRLPTFQQITQTAKLAGDHLQRCNRTIRFNRDSDQEELRKRFFVATLAGCAVSGIWLYGVLPSFVAGAVGFAGVRMLRLPVASSKQTMLQSAMAALRKLMLTCVHDSRTYKLNRS